MYVSLGVLNIVLKLSVNGRLAAYSHRCMSRTTNPEINYAYSLDNL